MKLRIEIETGNDAFRDPEEIGRILADLAERIPFGFDPGDGELSLHDANGNWVGYARAVPGEIDRDR